MRKSVNVIASFYPNSNQEEQVESILKNMVAPTRAESGNVRYDLYTSSNEPKSFHLIESYSDESALAFHRETAHYKHYRATIASLLAQPVVVLLIEPIDIEN